GVARPPQADALGVDDVQALEVADGASPVSDLAPRVHVLARRPIARAKAAVIVEQDDEARFGESPREPLDAMLLHAGVAMRHRDGGQASFAGWHEEPAAKLDAAVNFELNIGAFHHFDLLRGTHQAALKKWVAAILPWMRRPSSAENLS